MTKTILLSILLLLYGCSADGGSDGTGIILPPSTNNFLKPTLFSGNVLRFETRFVSYTKKANRVSIIDPINETETWGKAASGFNFAVHLPQFQGASLFADDKVVVMSGDDQQSFNLSVNYAHTSSAMQTASYGMASLDGGSFEVIRSLQGGSWQHETFSVPWGEIDPGITQPPQDQPVLLVTYFNDSGSELTVFAPLDGRYTQYVQNSNSGELEYTGNWCAGDGIGTPGDATFRSLAWDENEKIYYAGDKNGSLYALDPSASCVPVASLPQLAMPDALPITHISLLETRQLAVIQDEQGVPGMLTIVGFDGSVFTLGALMIDDLCDAPLGAMKLGSDYLVAMCAETAANPQDLSIDPRRYITVDVLTGTVVNTRVIERNTTAGVAVDPGSATLYRMLEGGFGNLEISNLITGHTRKTVGLYIKDILE